METDKFDLVMTSADTIEPEKRKRLWGGRFPRGKLSLIAAEYGGGTTILAAYIAATVSSGGDWPDDAGSATQADVIFIAPEGCAADTLRPRLEVAGADLARVQVVQGVKDEYGHRPFNLAEHMDLLKKALRKIDNPRLVIIDPFSDCLIGGKYGEFNPNNPSEVRTLLQELEALATRYDVAVIGVTKFLKATRGTPIARIGGSSALVATAQAIFTVTRDKDDPCKRIFSQVKNNLSREVEPVAFCIKMRKTTGDIPAPYAAFVTIEKGA